MNMNRLRPTGVAKDDLDLWLSGVINDAMRDATEAGLSIRSAAMIARSLAGSWGDREPGIEIERIKKRRLLENAREYILAANAEVNVVTRLSKLPMPEELIEGLTELIKEFES